MTPQQLKATRHAMGLTQAELYIAAQLGRSTDRQVQTVFISRMELGKRPVTKATDAKIRDLALANGIALA